jgi:hypothetical protein
MFYHFYHYYTHYRFASINDTYACSYYLGSTPAQIFIMSILILFNLSIAFKFVTIPLAYLVKIVRIANFSSIY